MTSPWGQLAALVCHPTEIVNKGEELACLSTNIGMFLALNTHFSLGWKSLSVINALADYIKVVTKALTQCSNLRVGSDLGLVKGGEIYVTNI
jgi:hypothetical protein